MKSKIIQISSVLLATSCAIATAETTQSLDDDSDYDAGSLVIWGEGGEAKDTNYVSPSSKLVPEDMRSINATTTEDLVKYEPSLVIRKRFIGDSNGTMGVRGSNMFQTTRSMVYADGVPLHYFLQTRWSGSPRWTLVSASEIAQVEVLYGPFSAEYSGNSMGGVVNIETAIPTERKFHVEGTFFSHDYSDQGFDGTLTGQKGFFSYSDKIGNFSIYTSFNHLENDGHPQTFRFGKTSAASGDETSVQGGLEGVEEHNIPSVFYGDTGITDVTTDNYKIKLGYEFDNWFALLNIAYEDRKHESKQANNYLTAADGTTVWSGSVVQDGLAFNVRESDFAESELDRRSLLLGLRIQGELSNNWLLEGDFSSFSVLEDESRESLTSSLSPAFTPAGEITDFDDTGWSTAEIKFQNDQFLSNDNLSLVTGIRYENYELTINNYDSDNYAAGIKTALTGSSGGETSMTAVYAQLGWQINQSWDAAFGGRYEDWSSKNGFFNDQQHIDRDESRFSPKFSIGYKTEKLWELRYSVAQAYRFPIVEELFQNERRTQGTALANANLEPEDGLHHNFMIQRNIEGGYFRINYFFEEIDDAIFAQTTIVENRGINTFIPIDTVETEGVEFIYNKIGAFKDKLDVRFNLTFTDSVIEKNSANTSLEGKTFPRVPEWRANLLGTYHVTQSWDVGGGIRFASNSFGDLNNSDKANNVFGAHDNYLFVNLKTNYQVNENTTLSLGIDNVTDEKVFVHHPWPQRTIYLQAAFDF